MEFAILGWPEDGPTLRLDHERFSYAGKFVMSNTGKAVVRDDGELIGVASFNRDRTDDAAMWLRYITIRTDRRGEGIGARLAAFTANRLLERADRVRIGVNNPFAYHALYKAGFGYTGERTGLAELVLERPGDRDPATYRRGLSTYRERPDLSAEERSFIERKADTDPPAVVSV